MASSAKTIGYIGTGSMGRPMIQKLLADNFTVQVYDKYKNTADEVVAAGAKWCDTPREAAIGMDIVCTCLPLPEHVYENMVGPDGGLAGMHAGSVWVDFSTTDYHNTCNIAEMGKTLGVYSMEAPVSNLSHMGVDFANMSYYAAGDRPGYDMLRRLLEVTGEIDFYVGKIGKAQSVKLLTNDMFYTGVVTFGEMTALIQEADIPLYWWWEYVKKSRGNTVASDQFSVFLFDGSWDTSCTLEIAIKDMSLTVAMAKEVGLHLPITEATNEAYDATKDIYDIYKGHIQVVRLTEEDNDIKLRIPNFVAPSKYGLNKAYQHPPGLLRDKFGRARPPLPPEYKAPPFEPNDNQLRLAEAACEYLALVNEAIYDEAIQLGIGMDVPRDTVLDTIRWSVGTCWVADNLNEFVAEKKRLEDIRAFVASSKLKMRNFGKVCAALADRHKWDLA